MSALPDMVELIRAVVRAEGAAVRTAEIGQVTKTHPHAASGDKANYACDVRLRDTPLELKKVPVATQRVGLAAMPNVGDLVLLAFVGGSLHGAVVIGRLYNDEDRPPEAKDHESVYVCPDEAESGVRRAYLEFPNGNTLLLDDDQIVVEAGSTTLTIKNGGDVELASAAKVTITSKGDMSLKSEGSLKLEAGGSLGLKAGTDAKVEGLSVTVKAQTSAQVEGGASAGLKGPLVTVAGNASFSPS